MKKGVTLIELLIAVVIAAIGLSAVSGLLYATWRNWYISNELKSLQDDIDLACLNIKAVVEEANYYEIQDIIGGSPPRGRSIYVRYIESGNIIWEKKFYPDGNKLVMQDIKNGSSDTVIHTLQSISFANMEEIGLRNTVNVEITVSKSGKTLQNIFSVKARNRN